MTSIAVLPGDGIGPEVVSTVLPVIERLGLPVSFRHGEVGWDSWCRHGNAVPEQTWQLLSETDTCLLGAITSKPVREAEAELAEHLRGTGLKYSSPVVQLRQRLSLYANVRPVVDIRADRFKFDVIRENTEGLYAGLDFHGLDENLWSVVREHPNADASGAEHTSATLRLQTRYGIDRLLRFGFEHAASHGFRRVTVADKPNVLRDSSHHLRERLELLQAEYPDIEAEILNVDAVALWMVRRPERFGVIIAENMFGDILSDLGAGVMGGLGLSPSGNLGEKGSYFEPVHGSAPAMEGLGKANPMALFLTVAQMFEHLGMPVPAGQLRSAIRSVARAGRSVTYDLGGTASTTQVTEAVEAELGESAPTPQASIVAVGDELCRGAVVDTNSARIGAMLAEAGYQVRLQQTVGDTLSDIRNCVGSRLGMDDVLVVVGGLGPTSDDVTREAVAAACGRDLVFSDTAWEALSARLESFNLAVHEDNRRQAMFPVESALVPNSNGTAMGARVDTEHTTVLMLPGPPKECLPMAEAAIAELPQGQRQQSASWRLLGVVEGDIASEVDEVLAGIDGVRVSYLWSYPYVDVTVSWPVDGAALPEALDQLLDPHTVSRHGRDAFAEVASLSDIAVSEVDLAFAADETLAGLQRVNVAVDAAQPAIGLRGTADWVDGSREKFTGTLNLHAVATVDGTEHRFDISVPNRGAEVADCAAAFFTWALVRARRATKTLEEQ